MTLLSDSQIVKHLADLGGWAREGNEIIKRFEFVNFVEAAKPFAAATG